MTVVYFVRHAQPMHGWEDDRTRPLTEDGKKDTSVVLDFFKEKKIDKFYCSPYIRSIDTIRSTAEYFNKEIITDFRLRERVKGENGNVREMFEKRWSNKDFCEKGGESINSVQRRNIEALNDILVDNEDHTIVIGTHATALSSILNYYNPEFGCKDFLRIIDWMPYIIELDFEGKELVKLTEQLHIVKEFKGTVR